MYRDTFCKNRCTELFEITLGAMLMGVALAVFLIPFKLAAGGVSGVATIIHFLTGIKTSYLIFAINIPIFVLAYICFGYRFLLRSFYGTFVLSAATEVMGVFSIPTDDPLLASAFGGVVMGVGISLVIRSGGTTGGTDIIVLAIRKYKPDLSVGRLFLFLDGAVILAAGIVFSGKETILYSTVVVYLCSYVADTSIEGLKFAKIVYIISEKTTEITSEIYTKMNRGVTGINSVSMYTGKNGKILMCAIKKYELTALKKLIYSVDDNAFVIISDAKEVMGNGFDTAGHNLK